VRARLGEEMMYHYKKHSILKRKEYAGSRKEEQGTPGINTRTLTSILSLAADFGYLAVIHSLTIYLFLLMEVSSIFLDHK